MDEKMKEEIESEKSQTKKNVYDDLISLSR